MMSMLLYSRQVIFSRVESSMQTGPNCALVAAIKKRPESPWHTGAGPPLKLLSHFSECTPAGIRCLSSTVTRSPARL